MYCAMRRVADDPGARVDRTGHQASEDYRSARPRRDDGFVTDAERCHEMMRFAWWPDTPASRSRRCRRLESSGGSPIAISIASWCRADATRRAPRYPTLQAIGDRLSDVDTDSTA